MKSRGIKESSRSGEPAAGRSFGPLARSRGFSLVWRDERAGRLFVVSLLVSPNDDQEDGLAFEFVYGVNLKERPQMGAPSTSS